MRPPSCAALNESASSHPETVPATVFAATPPRNGIDESPRSRYDAMLAPCAAAPHASMARGGSPGTWTSQNASPPMEFMCG